MPRRFPPSWSVEETAASFIVRDSGGQALAYSYDESEPGVASAIISAKLQIAAMRFTQGEEIPRRWSLVRRELTIL
jgi:hypothetical protein